ncbi:MAG: hypothetical protein EPO09_13355 [Aquabacterium sp.]|uniref:hypothetical protein n=1 Tax=Aquabacterium sp. TaxID=1872578 RepID=UPI001217BDAF|nr:hypothetical protein [Aquabacterium sp.]TAK93219.1 MAG: hypothetical protein EPO09_13355 [Aquabacterium sp.]
MKSNKMMFLRPSLRPVALAVAAGLSLGAMAPAQAGEDDTPLYLSLAHDITRDSNFSRDSNRQAETINSTALQVGIDKAYGRQTYTGSAKLSKLKYAHYGDLLNNDGKDINGEVASEFLRDWRVAVGGAFNQNLNEIQNNQDVTDRVSRNIRTYRDGNIALQYGVGGLLAVMANYDTNKTGYSADRYKNNESTQHSNGLRLTYYSTDLFNYFIGQRLVRTNYPNNLYNKQIDDANTDVGANWQVTGLSNLNATLTRRTSVFSSTHDQPVHGWTGGLNWRYTPAGIVTYGVGLQRATGADRAKSSSATINADGLTLKDYSVNNNSVNTILSLMAKAQLTGKTSLTTNYGLTRFAVDNKNVNMQCNSQGNLPSCSDTGVPADQSSSIAHVTTLGLNYAATRSVNLGCSYQKYSQTVGAGRVAYDGHSVDCSASLTID